MNALRSLIHRRRLHAPLALALCALGIGACGAGEKAAVRTARASVKAQEPLGSAPLSGPLRGDGDDDDSASSYTSQGPLDSDSDVDNDSGENASKGYHDSDDALVTRFGHRPNARERRAIATLVERYAAAAANADGARACSLMYAILEESITAQFAQAPGPAYLRNLRTCPAVLTVLFKHMHGSLAQPFRITDVRVKGNHAEIPIGWATMPASLMEARRELGTWKIDRVLPGALP